jgi:hypothetical protein
MRVGEWRYSSTHSLTSALDGGEWSASHPGRFTPRERALGTHSIVGCVGLRAVLDAVMKRKIPSPRRESYPRTPIVQPVTQHYTDGAITTVKLNVIKLIKCKGKDVCAFFLYWAPRHEGVLGVWRYSSTNFLTSAWDGDEWSASRPGRFTTKEPTHLIFLYSALIHKNAHFFIKIDFRTCVYWTLRFELGPKTRAWVTDILSQCILCVKWYALLLTS